MKKINLIALLIATVITLTVAVAGAVSVQDIKSSSLTSEQKTELYQLLKDSKAAEADSVFNVHQASLELDKIAKAAQAELEKAWTAQVRPDSMTYDKCIDEWCDSTDKAMFLATRWNLEELDPTMDLDGMKATLHEAINNKLEEQKKARERARIAHLEQLVNVIATHNAVQDTMIAKIGNQTFDNTFRLDTIEQRLTDDEFDMAAALRELAKQAKLKDDDVRPTIQSASTDIAARANENK